MESEANFFLFGNDTVLVKFLIKKQFFQIAYFELYTAL